MKTTPILTFIAVMLSGASLQAAENMSFRGTLLEHPPCEINGGQPIAIDFGDVGVNKVDGENYAQTFQIIYDCKGTSTDKILRYVGNATAFDPAAVQSNIPDFGIQLRHTSLQGVTSPFAVGSTLPIPAYVGSSTFIATPVKKASTELQDGAFTAGATLQLEYP
ncbi:fimbrial protein [Serratia entomophila]|uniref:fimbrial protein n=1 Tax=Serratia entomophila TaxID=42906 RepID=UPI002178519A|nr:fimbrial protein [Serratia entomophila]CAI1707296.1 Minor fimbrial protein prsF precursor [Serratia entomophila]CAI1748757.1 Minor fimbrial protein prsF precursor [Serratia entomophila]